MKTITRGVLGAAIGGGFCLAVSAGMQDPESVQKNEQTTVTVAARECPSATTLVMRSEATVVLCDAGAEEQAGPELPIEGTSLMIFATAIGVVVGGVAGAYVFGPMDRRQQ